MTAEAARPAIEAAARVGPGLGMEVGAGTALSIGVGMGGWLLGDVDPVGVRERAAQIVAAVAAARARLGHSVAFIGREGADGFGDAIR